MKNEELFFKTFVRMSLREIIIYHVEAHGRASKELK